MIVVDASVVGKWLFRDEVRATYAATLLSNAVDTGERICAPLLVAFEATNFIRQRMVREGLSLALAHDLVDEFLALPLTLISVPPLHHDALTLCDAHLLPAAYDAHYVALAQHLSCP